ncbi:hypothetical protein FNV43_RR15587 [Rhamnella rubrinervis]|uniref:F-box domain-containing protein n=1 Tax=Rhamnella rubrinervis TaxID=2594499 RepID=A0A8K0GUD9_9ROSA|nr:hypothetical protein FNV43_RR15587 [Rhamnella rubrinervis]
MKNHEEKKDEVDDTLGNSTILEDLPDEIIVDIVSLLPLKEAVAISVLSRRWRYTWRFTRLKSLNFGFDITADMHDIMFMKQKIEYHLSLREMPNFPINEEVEVLEYSSKFDDVDRVLYLVRNTVALEKIVVDCKYYHRIRLMKTKQQIIDPEVFSRMQHSLNLNPNFLLI